MRIFSKDKDSLPYLIYNLCGVRCIRKLIRPAVKTIINGREAEFVSSIWNAYGVNDKLLEYFDLARLSPFAWKEFPPRFWLIYLQCLVRKGDLQKARQILDKYFSHRGYDLDGFEEFLLLSDFANSNGFTNEKIKKASVICNKLKEARNADHFKKILADKSIAVVGNGPSEIGKGKGQEIDAHDIVIRFNNFTTPRYADDYGTKTDIWCRGALWDVKNRTEKFKLVAWENDYDHQFVRDDIRDVIYRQIQEGQEIYNFDFDCHMSLRNASGLDAPTAGAVLIWEIYRKRGNFENVDFYGFNFCAEKFDPYATHYFKDRSDGKAKLLSCWHDFMGEAKFFSNLIYGKKL